jgi:hypothetical protein
LGNCIPPHGILKVSNTILYENEFQNPQIFQQTMHQSFSRAFYFSHLIFFNLKVGGIYTVIRSKTGVSVNELGDQYIVLGPYMESKARQEIEEEDFPFHHPLGQAVDR